MPQWQKFRKKPIVIEAFQVSNQLFEAIQKSHSHTFHFNDVVFRKHIGHKGKTIVIGTLEGSHEVSLDDWIIRGIVGEVYPVKPKVFEKTYELVN